MNIFQFFGIESDFEVACIPITDDMVKTAREYSSAVERIDKIRNTKNYTGLVTPDRYYYGALGEIAFARFLTDNKVSFDWKLSPDGKADNGDFIIADKVFDVKTSSKEYADRLLVSKAQRSVHKADYYVAVKIIGSNAFIIGLVRDKSLSEERTVEYYPGVKNYYVLFNQMKKRKKVG